MLIQISFELNIELNAKDILNGMTPFHWACHNSNTNILEMILENAESFKIDIKIRDKFGRTGFQHAKNSGKTDVVNLFYQTIP